MNLQILFTWKRKAMESYIEIMCIIFLFKDKPLHVLSLTEHTHKAFSVFILCNLSKPPAHSVQAQSIQITHCLASQVPSMPNQFPAIDSFNVLHHTAGLSVYVCMFVCVWKRKSWGSTVLSVTLYWEDRSYNSVTRNMEIVLLCLSRSILMNRDKLK